MRKSVIRRTFSSGMPRARGERPRRKNKALAVPFVLWAVLFIAVPLAMVVWYGVTVEETRRMSRLRATTARRSFSARTARYGRTPAEADGRSPRQFQALESAYLLKLLLRSLKIALFTTIICLLLDYPSR